MVSEKKHLENEPVAPPATAAIDAARFKQIILTAYGDDAWDFFQEKLLFFRRDFKPTAAQLDILQEIIDGIGQLDGNDVVLLDFPVNHVRRSGRSTLIAMLAICLAVVKKVNVLLVTHVLATTSLARELNKWICNNPQYSLRSEEMLRFDVMEGMIGEVTSGYITITTDDQ